MTTIAEKLTVKSAIWTIKSCSKFNPETNLAYKIFDNVFRSYFNEDTEMGSVENEIDELMNKAIKYKNIFPNQVEVIAEYIMQNESLLLTVSETINNA